MIYVKNEKKGEIILEVAVQLDHLGGQSHGGYDFEMEKSRNWHWMWSKFYFYKKHNNYNWFFKNFTKLY